MGKIRLKDLARTMKVPEQDLMFKLKSIGVRLEGSDPEIDSEIIQAILQGKSLPQPREVILRDDADAAPVKPAPVAKPRQPATPAVRPQRRSMIQRVEGKIKELEIKGREDGTAPASPAAKSEGGAPLEAAAEPMASLTVEPGAVESTPVAAVESTSAPAPAAPTEVSEVAAEVKKDEAPAPKPTPKAAASAKAPAGSAKAEPPRGLRKRARLISRPDEPVKPPSSVSAPPPRRRGRNAETRPQQAATGAGTASSAYTGGGGGGGGGGSAGRDGRGRGAGGGRGRQGRGRGRQPSAPTTPPPMLKPASARGHRRAQKREEMAGQQDHGIQFKESRPDGPVTITHGMTVRDFAEKLGVKAKDLIKTLFSQGVMATINHKLDLETATKLADSLGVEVMEVSFEEEVQLQHEEQVEGGVEKEPRAPVVTVMGHVDHGKTTLLDAIRQTNVAEGEAGGITQHIGAYHVDLEGKRLVFLDTPGHEAFTMMRARGASVTDIVVLVVAADDSVMPQTIEAISHAKAARVPIVVAINKIDKPNANLDRVRKELADHGLLVEDWGGDVVSQPLSALKREGISELLEMILLTADLQELKAAPSLPARGVVLEARKDVGRGIVATVVIQDGTLHQGDVFVAGSTFGRVRSMVDDRGDRLKESGPSTAVELTGWDAVPAAGDVLQVYDDESKVREIAEFRHAEMRERDLAPRGSRMSLENLFDQLGKVESKTLPVVVKGDVHGSIEVLRDTLTKLSTEKVKLEVIHTSVGAISTNDVLLASASNAIIVGFNVRPERNASQLAEKEEVDIRLHTVIYELLDEIKAAMAGLLEPTFREVVRGSAEVREIFKVPRIGMIAGCMVSDGVIPRNAGVRLLRDHVVVYEGKLGSLRRFKDDVSEVRQGFECGIGLEHFQDVKPGDVIEAYEREEVAPTLE